MVRRVPPGGGLVYEAGVSAPPRQPVFNIPVVVLVLIGAMAAIQGLRDAMPDLADANLLARFAFVPGRLTFAFDPAGVAEGLKRLDLGQDAGREAFAAGRFFLGDAAPQPWTALTYAVLHGGWTHLTLNAVWLLAFGAPLARRLGVVRFIAFVALGAVAGAITHFAVDPFSLQPLVGASAAVSACMGAALRFLFQPAADPREASRPRPGAGPRLPLLAVFADRRARAFLLVWFVSNLVTGVGAIPLGLSAAPIAWQAHVGGFLVGLLVFPLFDPQRPPRPPEAVAVMEG